MGEERSRFGWERSDRALDGRGAIAFWDVLVVCDRFLICFGGECDRCGMGESDRFLGCFGGGRSLGDGRERSLVEIFWWGAIVVGWERAIAF